MNLWLAYNIALGVGLLIVGAWAYNAHRHVKKGYRGSYEDPPTEEIPCPATVKIGPRVDQTADIVAYVQGTRVEPQIIPWPPERR